MILSFKWLIFDHPILMDLVWFKWPILLVKNGLILERLIFFLEGILFRCKEHLFIFPSRWTNLSWHPLCAGRCLYFSAYKIICLFWFILPEQKPPSLGRKFGRNQSTFNQFSIKNVVKVWKKLKRYFSHLMVATGVRYFGSFTKWYTLNARLLLF